MSDFSKEINNFQVNGTYTYNFDEGGNLIFNSSSPEFEKNYLSVPLENCNYDNTKIKSFYDLEFKEFIPTSTTTIVETTQPVSSEVIQLTQENEDLKNKLTILTETADANITEPERLATKQVIIDLRIGLKQGIAERDFSTTFPYLPLTKNTR